MNKDIFFMFHSWRDCQLAFLDKGNSSAPVILLLHGFASSLRANWLFPNWIKFLCDAGFRVVALDHLGHGESDKPRDPAFYNLVLMAADAVSLLDFLGISKAHVIGYSMGARIAT
ncbi:alpha/beta fold hydrolase, partial [Candidatus Liberibacter sp.]|uniref:alpha/beta fold hydrolase n=1 Tax=Candidatus Liberibacter sp. TaxID=34022 RepID=UPI0015F677F2